MRNIFFLVIIPLLFFSPLLQADSTLEYEFISEEGDKTKYTININGRWLRFQSEPRGSSDYVVMDTGRLMMFEINDADKSYQLTRMGRLYWPETALISPDFQPLSKKQSVSGIRCQPVNEVLNTQKSFAEHCMTSGGQLGLNAREMISLSRLFMYGRRIGLDWYGVATPDERQVSLSSEYATGSLLKFKSVDRTPLKNSLFKVPVAYQRLKPDLPVQ